LDEEKPHRAAIAETGASEDWSMLRAAASRVGEDRHKFLAEYVRSAHTDSLSGKTHAKMGWSGSDVAFERQVLCYEDCDYSIAVGVLFRNSKHNVEIAAETIKRIEMLQCK